MAAVSAGFGGTGFWHEAYFLRGGIDTMYDDMTVPTGLGRVAPTVAMRGRLFSARGRVQHDEPKVAPVVREKSYYPDNSE
ncbi:hypothetical protein [Nocardia sp. N2S4-5]|uniref:hypothetical protein n=1 Tax=Nocardia sp. N2S4-5 TaxID=3351565 RepID=UPI0037D8D0AF